MPCGDITELLRLALDASDRVTRYTLTKRTCGAAVGEETLLASQVVGQTLEAVMELAVPTDFLGQKHLRALQAAALALRGAEPSHASARCTPTALVCDGDGISLEALIRVDADARQVKSCGNCGRCGAHDTTGS